MGRCGGREGDEGDDESRQETQRRGHSVVVLGNGGKKRGDDADEAEAANVPAGEHHPRLMSLAAAFGIKPSRPRPAPTVANPQ